jgi:mRNA-degrading endonuclease RelE of RelBE toxin-antitoxin system
MNDAYDLRVSATAGSTLSGDPHLTSGVRSFVDRLRTDLVGVLTSEDVVRVPDKVILGRDDPNLAFYRFRQGELEIGFYVDRSKKLVVITSVTRGPKLWYRPD